MDILLTYQTLHSKGYSPILLSINKLVGSWQLAVGKNVRCFLKISHLIIQSFKHLSIHSLFLLANITIKI